MYDGRSDFVEVAYKNLDEQFRDIAILTEEGEKIGEPYRIDGKRIYFSLYSSLKRIMKNDTLYATYQVNDTYTIDYNIKAVDGYRIDFAKHDGGKRIVYQEGNRYGEPVKLATMVDMNPIQNQNHEGFLYVTNTINKTDSFRVTVTPDRLPADGSSYSTLIIEPLDYQGNFISHANLEIKADRGFVARHISQDAVEAQKRSGQHLYQYVAPYIQAKTDGDTIEDHIWITDKDNNIGISYKILLRLSNKPNAYQLKRDEKNNLTAKTKIINYLLMYEGIEKYEDEKLFSILDLDQDGRVTLNEIALLETNKKDSELTIILNKLEEWEVKTVKLQPHKDLIREGLKNRGYAIRVGNKVPVNSANLAYVQSKPVSPEENILLEDVSSQIKENGLSSFIDEDYIVYPNKDFLLETAAGQNTFPTDSISITDEFTVAKNRQDVPKPTFYKMELKGRFDVRTAQVLPYIGGLSSETVQDAVSFEDIPINRRNELLYVGDSIRIEAVSGTMHQDNVFKVQLVRESNFIYRIILYTNFQSEKEMTYKVVYPNYRTDTKQSELKEEVLNAYPFFEQVTVEQFKETVKLMNQNPDNYKHLKIYAVSENQDNFAFYATSDVMIANYQTRTPQLFKHRVEGKLKTKLSETNPGKMNIGFYFVQGAISVENLTSIGKAINESLLLPSYVELVNPHPPELDLIKRDIRYWSVDLEMPKHHYEDYDLIIITGYGTVDLSMYKDKFNHYLSNGGVIWVDNAGSQTKVLNFKSSKGSTFIADISFSSSSSEFGVKEIKTKTSYVNRLYPVTDAADLGYKNVAPVIVFGQDEESSQWTNIVSHTKGGPSIIKKTYQDKGTLIVSNCGIFRAVYHNQRQNVNFVLNTILYHAEEQWIFLLGEMNSYTIVTIYSPKNIR
ncbi:hypothetical protein AAAC51_07610 [Priestia megaterium]